MEDNDSEGEVFCNLFEEIEVESSPAINREINTEKHSCMTDLLGMFSDDYFTEDQEKSKSENSNSADSSTHSGLSFGLFDDESDEDDDNDNTDTCSHNRENPEVIQTTSSCDKSKSKVEKKYNSDYIAVGNRHEMNQAHRGHNHIRTDNIPEWTGPTPDDDEFCCICMDAKTDPKTLHRCSHSFCTDCIEESFKIKPVCPVCFVAYGVITGNQPEGHMNDSVSKINLPGYENTNTIIVSYSFGNGTQKENHPHPGVKYEGTCRTAYLPNNAEGKKVLRLLKESFKRKLTFTIGRSRTTGCDNVVTWNDIHHKTCTHGGQENFGYPDPTYLQRVQEELAAVGVTEESLNSS